MSERVELPERPSERVGYEASDVRLRPILVFTLALGLVLAAAWSVTVWLGHSFTRELRDAEPTNPMRDWIAAPQGPVLQSFPAAELAETRAREERWLHGTEWIDRENGIVRIPVERALELALEEGFPTRPSVRAPSAEKGADR